jgi:hypothetical protein
MGPAMSASQSIGVSVTWAISQYRSVVDAVSKRARSIGRINKQPRESAETLAYLRSIGLGQNVDAYA